MSGLLWFSDGRTGAFDCGFKLPLRGWLEITGTDGVVTVPEMWLPSPRATFYVQRENRPPEEVAVEGEDQIVHMLEDFARAVSRGEPVQPAPEEAVRTLRVMDALARSARAKIPMDVLIS